MNFFDLATATIVVISLLLVWKLWDRWFSRSARWDEWNAPEGGQSKLDPEGRFIVSISDETISCTRPDGVVESIKKSNLTMVEIATTDEGPFAPDVFWLLHADEGGVLIPWGATGEDELLDYLQSLPKFRNEAIGQAAATATNDRFTCWKTTEGN